MLYGFQEDLIRFVSRREIVRHAMTFDWGPEDGDPYEHLNLPYADDLELRGNIVYLLRGLPRELLEPWCGERTGMVFEETELMAGCLAIYYTQDEDLLEDEPVDEWWRDEHKAVQLEQARREACERKVAKALLKGRPVRESVEGKRTTSRRR